MIRVLLVSLLTLCGVTSSQAQTRPERTMAVTIDDLPFVNPGGANFLSKARQATAAIFAFAQGTPSPRHWFRHRIQAACSRRDGSARRAVAAVGGCRDDVGQSHLLT